jgi:hypothetical protein
MFARRPLVSGNGALAVLLVVLAGCSPLWARPNTTREQINHDMYECQYESYVAPPRERESLYKLCMRSRGYRETTPDAGRPRR